MKAAKNSISSTETRGFHILKLHWVHCLALWDNLCFILPLLSSVLISTIAVKSEGWANSSTLPTIALLAHWASQQTYTYLIYSGICFKCHSNVCHGNAIFWLYLDFCFIDSITWIQDRWIQSIFSLKFSSFSNTSNSNAREYTKSFTSHNVSSFWERLLRREAGYGRDIPSSIRTWVDSSGAHA